MEHEVRQLFINDWDDLWITEGAINRGIAIKIIQVNTCMEIEHSG